jgi:hypothetical protein
MHRHITTAIGSLSAVELAQDPADQPRNSLGEGVRAFGLPSAKYR